MYISVKRIAGVAIVGSLKNVVKIFFLKDLLQGQSQIFVIN